MFKLLESHVWCHHFTSFLIIEVCLPSTNWRHNDSLCVCCCLFVCFECASSEPHQTRSVCYSSCYGNAFTIEESNSVYTVIINLVILYGHVFASKEFDVVPILRWIPCLILYFLAFLPCGKHFLTNTEDLNNRFQVYESET